MLQLQQQLQQSNVQLQEQKAQQAGMQQSLKQLAESNRQLGSLKGAVTSLQIRIGQPGDAISPSEGEKGK